MVKNNIFTILLFGSLCASVTTAGAEVIFSDSFESGDMSATNADGFKWQGADKISIVTQDPVKGPVQLFLKGTPKVQILSPLMPDGSDREYTAKDGQNSLKFDYLAGDPWTEQRFDMGAGYPEVWMSYQIRVPLNYLRGKDGASAGPNGKWMMFGHSNAWTFYSAGGTNISKIVVSDWPSQTGAGIGGVGIDLDMQLKSGGGWIPNSRKYRNFVLPSDAGRWMKVIYHFKSSSVNGAADGRVNMYRKWEDEPAFKYITGYENVVIDLDDESLAAGYNGWGGGYLLGYVNRPYANETEWLIDDFIISTTSMLPNPPLPPAQVRTVVNPK